MISPRQHCARLPQLVSITVMIILLLVAIATSACAKCIAGSSAEDHRLGPLRTLTPIRPVSDADRKRAASILAEVRATLHSYRRREAAIAAGYDYRRGFEWNAYFNVPRASGGLSLRPPRVNLHLPTALLYARATRPSAGVSSPALVGALFTAESNTTGESLNDIVPLSIARWVRIHLRCTRPGPDIWTLEIFPYERSSERAWQIPLVIDVTP
jgi:hypothetical protein